MPLNERDMSYFIDIIDFTSNISYLDFKNEKMRKLAVERQLEIIGQASVKISREVQEMYPNIPWPQIIGLRNRLAHDYKDYINSRK